MLVDVGLRAVAGGVATLASVATMAGAVSFDSNGIAALVVVCGLFVFVRGHFARAGWERVDGPALVARGGVKADDVVSGLGGSSSIGAKFGIEVCCGEVTRWGAMAGAFAVEPFGAVATRNEDIQPPVKTTIASTKAAGAICFGRSREGI